MKRVVVFGYGAVGREVAKRLLARGDDVVVAQRWAPSSLLEGSSFRACDITQSESTVAACAARDIAICAVGFRYDWRVWERSWPAAMQALISACSRAGARFVFADNLYMLGPQTQALTEEMPLTEYGEKPRLRAKITRLWQQAHAAGLVKVVAVRASDFYGPDVPTSVLSEYGVARLIAQRAALVPYSPDFPHDFTYVPDFARALVTLADAPDDAYGQAWNVPNAPTRSVRELLSLAAKIAGVPMRIQAIPAWLQPLLAIVQPATRELAELRFQTDRTYQVDATKYTRRFGPAFTSFQEGLSATVEYYRRARR